MLLLGIISVVLTCVFGFRWFSEHAHEYMYGVKPSEQLDRNFWLCLLFGLLDFVFLPIALL